MRQHSTIDKFSYPNPRPLYILFTVHVRCKLKVYYVSYNHLSSIPFQIPLPLLKFVIINLSHLLTKRIYASSLHMSKPSQHYTTISDLFRIANFQNHFFYFWNSTPDKNCHINWAKFFNWLNELTIKKDSFPCKMLRIDSILSNDIKNDPWTYGFFGNNFSTFMK